MSFFTTRRETPTCSARRETSSGNSICWMTRLTSTVETRTSWLPKMPTEMYTSYLMVTDFFIYNRKEDELQHFSTADKNSLFHSNFLLSVFIDRSGCIWICTGEGVYCCRELNLLQHRACQDRTKYQPGMEQLRATYQQHRQ